MRIAAWNVNLRTTRRRLHPQLADAIVSLDADIAILSEYVAKAHDRASHERLCDALRAGGFIWFHLTEHGPLGENQILIASKKPAQALPLTPPAIDWAGPGVAAVRCADLEIVGLRIPSYEKRAEARAYWSWLTDVARARTDRQTLIIGDMNEDVISPRRQRAAISAIAELGWTLPDPAGDWSFAKHGGAPRSRIDHVLAAPGIDVTNARYVAEHASFVLAGARTAISDHAALVVDVADTRAARVLAQRHAEDRGTSDK